MFEVKVRLYGNFIHRQVDEKKVDAAKSRTLACPAEPLAACAQRQLCTLRTITPSTECHGSLAMWIKSTKTEGKQKQNTSVVPAAAHQPGGLIKQTKTTDKQYKET